MPEHIVSVYSTCDIYLCSDDALIMMEKTKDVEGKGKRVRRWSLWPRVLHQLMASKCTSFRTKLSTPLVSCSAQCCLLTKLCPVTTSGGLLTQLNGKSSWRYANQCHCWRGGWWESFSHSGIWGFRKGNTKKNRQSKDWFSNFVNMLHGILNKKYKENQRNYIFYNIL